MIASVANSMMKKEILKDDSYYKAYKDFRLVRLILDSKYGIKKTIFNKFFHNYFASHIKFLIGIYPLNKCLKCINLVKLLPRKV